MAVNLKEELKSIVQGEVADDNETIARFSRDASLFEIKPRIVVYPKNSGDLKNLVKFVSEKKSLDQTLSLTARSGGTDMSGGPLNNSIILDFTKHFNCVKKVGDDYAVVEPGTFYRDFEKETLKKNLFLPSYPASREICTIGGMVANDAGGEKTLRYGKTKDYIEQLKVVLADGNEYMLQKLNRGQLEQKMNESTFESRVYRELFIVLEHNYNLIQKSKPNVHKNSSGYDIWGVWDKRNFDLTKLFVGSQGTLGLITEIKSSLIKPKQHSGLIVIYEKTLQSIAKLVQAILPLQPTSFEGFDHHTLRLALRFMPDFVKMLNAKNILSLAWQFLPEFWYIFSNGMPQMIILVEFEGDSQKEVLSTIKTADRKLKALGLKTRIAPDKKSAQKYWFIRRESFNLLRKKVRGKQTAPFIDDIIVRPEFLPEFLPKLYALLDQYKLLYTIAGHIGDGNFHIIPLMKLADKNDRDKILSATRAVYNLVLSYGGSITAEHNDGLIRTPFIKQMYGKEIYAIFEKVKHIFDPQNIFNPHKKVGADIEYSFAHIKKS